MSSWETEGRSNDWYTPPRVFDALGCKFDLDVAHPPAPTKTYVPATEIISMASLEKPWHGFVWMNPPWCGRDAKAPWLDKFFAHGNGIALTPDRTSAPWWHPAVRRADAVLFVTGKIKFHRPDGSVGKSPGTGTTLFAAGAQGVEALRRADAAGLGVMMRTAA